jgi:dihydrodipicolinate synthase/N-acetylneuraminate lyase
MELFTHVKPRRKIVGMSAVLLPFTSAAEIDWPSFRTHLMRTRIADLIPAVNMDTGYVNLLDPDSRRAVLEQTRAVLDGAPFVAGAFIGDEPGAHFDADGYRREIDLIQRHGGLPIIFQSFGMAALEPQELIDAYRAIARDCQRFLAFELGEMFAPFGRIYDLPTYGELLAIPQCIGAKHSSLSRAAEWQRLAMRDERRPDFIVLTGNDLAIDMVMYGSDYLLGLSTFAPDLFARRDALWHAGDPSFYELTDLLQYLGCFAFRTPIPAYKHSAAQFLRLRGWLICDATHPRSPRRPDSDCAVLAEIWQRLEAWNRSRP